MITFKMRFIACLVMAIINLFLLVIDKAAGDEGGATFSLFILAVCCLGAFLNLMAMDQEKRQ